MATTNEPASICVLWNGVDDIFWLDTRNSKFQKPLYSVGKCLKRRIGIKKKKKAQN